MKCRLHRILRLVLGLYEHAVPEIVRSLETLMSDTNKLFDHPTYRLCRLTLVEMQDVQQYGDEAILCLVDKERRASLREWSATLDRILQTAGGLDGTTPAKQEEIAPVFSAEPYTYDPTPCRDERFKDPYNMGVNAEAMLLDPTIDPLPKSIMLYFKRMREIDVPEMIASILSETSGKSVGILPRYDPAAVG